MALGSHYIFFLIALFLATNLFSQDVINQSPQLINSVLTQAGSRAVSYEYTDETSVIRTTKIQQSIGQNGIVGLSKTSLNSVQQGFLNHIKTLKIDNPTDEFIETKEMFIYPNPFKNFVNVKFSKPTIYTIQIEVFDVRGRLVLNQKFQPSSLISVPTDRLEDASYIIRVSSGSQEYLKKIIKGIN